MTFEEVSSQFHTSRVDSASPISLISVSFISLAIVLALLSSKTGPIIRLVDQVLNGAPNKKSSAKPTPSPPSPPPRKASKTIKSTKPSKPSSKLPLSNDSQEPSSTKPSQSPVGALFPTISTPNKSLNPDSKTIVSCSAGEDLSFHQVHNPQTGVVEGWDISFQLAGLPAANRTPFIVDNNCATNYTPAQPFLGLDATDARAQLSTSLYSAKPTSNNVSQSQNVDFSDFQFQQTLAHHIHHQQQQQQQQQQHHHQRQAATSSPLGSSTHSTPYLSQSETANSTNSSAFIESQNGSIAHSSLDTSPYDVYSPPESECSQNTYSPSEELNSFPTSSFNDNILEFALDKPHGIPFALEPSRASVSHNASATSLSAASLSSPSHHQQQQQLPVNMEFDSVLGSFNDSETFPEVANSFPNTQRKFSEELLADVIGTDFSLIDFHLDDFELGMPTTNEPRRHHQQIPQSFQQVPQLQSQLSVQSQAISQLQAQLRQHEQSIAVQLPPNQQRLPAVQNEQSLRYDGPAHMLSNSNFSIQQSMVSHLPIMDPMSSPEQHSSPSDSGASGDEFTMPSNITTGTKVATMTHAAQRPGRIHGRSIMARGFPFACPHCDASFRIRGYLTRHMKKHALQKAYTCPFYDCDQENPCHPNGGFSRRDTYKTHLKARHFVYPTGTRSENRAKVGGTCRGCGSKFESNEEWVEEHIHKKQCPGLAKYNASA